jgi:hypothetical protein
MRVAASALTSANASNASDDALSERYDDDR